MTPDTTIGRAAGDDELSACAAIMSSSEPWITLGIGYDDCAARLRDPAREVYVAKAGGDVIGFVIINMQGPFVGYIQTVAVHAQWRDRGVGSRIITFAEERIFSESPNVFMCVSSFNDRARRLYERLGYELVGELRDFIVRGHSEFLLRKTRGPLREVT